MGSVWIGQQVMKALEELEPVTMPDGSVQLMKPHEASIKKLRPKKVTEPVVPNTVSADAGGTYVASSASDGSSSCDGSDGGSCGGE